MKKVFLSFMFALFSVAMFAQGSWALKMLGKRSVYL
jgi:hypothetical protein